MDKINYMLLPGHTDKIDDARSHAKLAQECCCLCRSNPKLAALQARTSLQNSYAFHQHVSRQLAQLQLAFAIQPAICQVFQLVQYFVHLLQKQTHWQLSKSLILFGTPLHTWIRPPSC